MDVHTVRCRGCGFVTMGGTEDGASSPLGYDACLVCRRTGFDVLSG